tara:strand:+ start:23205 stop:24485 length:1281 start_codon:yes stop_codon:yes gene_type:complete
MSVAVIGDLIIDEYLYGESSRLSPEAPVPVIEYTHKKFLSGGAGNVAQNLKKLKVKTDLFAILDKTWLDEILVGNTHLNLQNVLPSNGLKSHKTRIYTNNHYYARIDHDLKYDNQQLFNLILKTDFSKYSCVIISDYAKGTLGNKLNHIIYHIKKTNNKIIVDPKNNLSKYSDCWLLKPNLKEFEQTVGKCNNNLDIIEKGRAVLESVNAEYLLVTLGNKGMILISKDKFKFRKAIAKEVFDVTGAGDTVTASIAYGIDKNYSVNDAVELANQGASAVVTKKGTSSVSQKDLGIIKTVFTNGVFDLLHSGHVDYLKKTKKLGDKLVVGLNSDESVKRIKGDDRPVVNQEDRKKMLLALDFVDEVIIFEENTPLDLINKIKPDIITKGGDYKKEDVIGHDIVKKTVIIPLLEGHSTTKIIEKVKNAA